MLPVPSTKSPHLNRCFVFLLQRCKSMSELKRIHAQITTHGLSADNFLISKLLFSAVFDYGDIDYSCRVFRTLPAPTTFIYNTLIRGFSKSKNPNSSISLYTEMLRAGVSPDHLTFPFLAKSCARLSSLRLGLSVHAHIAKSGLEFDLFVQNSLIHLYASCDDILSARRVFDGISQPNVVSWNALVDGYAKCGNIAAAREAFDRMPERDVVSWSALIDGYVKGGEYREALALFEMMQAQAGGPKANEVTMVSVLCACAHLGALDKGREMHRHLEENGLRLSPELLTSLIDMYAKCGSIHEGLEVFHAVPTQKTDVLMWNAMIGGLAMHGLGKESVEMFREMQRVGMVPDEITYLGLLSSCAHGGLVEDAWAFFRSLKAQGMTPHVEHYACMVDVLCRAGCMEEAYEFVSTMPIEPSASVLGALLSGCQTHGWVKLGEIVGKRLIKLEPEHDGRYIGLSNVYAIARRWEEAKTMREAMEKRGVKKLPGYSEIEVDGGLHIFIAHDKAHPQSTEVYSMLIVVAMQMKMEYNGIIQEPLSL
ncbi:LOW QUALITY PROTEIN: pentatricopeptide repeat-containing protein At5g08305-like [Phoenix dactylifera]|uniref:LOW QUALITY PROTEIN: pentatricopeptide repeat-containing protein At5g08305-like n=1 Tax=Phoenix dactylifera TaxID=42345 RepID=A0A8B9A183_PHODC|nr:LOW QUALITY PROTEIN: pentatricopeptide repeat-containing protein At5g08305-like [Phoenix dactylifera]